MDLLKSLEKQDQDVEYPLINLYVAAAVAMKSC